MLASFLRSDCVRFPAMLPGFVHSVHHQLHASSPGSEKDCPLQLECCFSSDVDNLLVVAGVVAVVLRWVPQLIVMVNLGVEI